jgi:hypothetical protein
VFQQIIQTVSSVIMTFADLQWIGRGVNIITNNSLLKDIFKPAFMIIILILVDITQAPSALLTCTVLLNDKAWPSGQYL